MAICSAIHATSDPRRLGPRRGCGTLAAMTLLSFGMTPPAPPVDVHVIHQLATGRRENSLVNLVNAMPRTGFRHAVVCIEDFSAFRARISDADVEVVALHRSRIGIWR